MKWLKYIVFRKEIYDELAEEMREHIAHLRLSSCPLALRLRGALCASMRWWRCDGRESLANLWVLAGREQ